MNAVSFIIIGIIMLVLGNTMIMSARERTREYAVLKTLGFSGGHLFGLIFGESMLISAFGAVAGLLITYPFVAGIEAKMPKGFFRISYHSSNGYTCGAAALTIGVLASHLPAAACTADEDRRRIEIYWIEQ